MAVTCRVDKCTGTTFPYQHQSFIFLLFLFLFILFFNFLYNLFFNHFSNVPSLNTDAKFIVFGEDIKLRGQDFALIFVNDMLDFCDKLLTVDVFGNLFNQEETLPLTERFWFLSDFLTFEMLVDSDNNVE